jgi:hypothetical protein
MRSWLGFDPAPQPDVLTAHYGGLVTLIAGHQIVEAPNLARGLAP